MYGAIKPHRSLPPIPGLVVWLFGRVRFRFLRAAKPPNPRAEDSFGSLSLLLYQSIGEQQKGVNE